MLSSSHQVGIDGDSAIMAKRPAAKRRRPAATAVCHAAVCALLPAAFSAGMPRVQVTLSSMLYFLCTFRFAYMVRIQHDDWLTTGNTFRYYSLSNFEYDHAKNQSFQLG